MQKVRGMLLTVVVLTEGKDTVFVAVRLQVRGETVLARTLVLCACEANDAVAFHHVELGKELGARLDVELVAGHEGQEQI